MAFRKPSMIHTKHNISIDPNPYRKKLTKKEKWVIYPSLFVMFGGGILLLTLIMALAHSLST